MTPFRLSLGRGERVPMTGFLAEAPKFLCLPDFLQVMITVTYPLSPKE